MNAYPAYLRQAFPKQRNLYSGHRIPASAYPSSFFTSRHLSKRQCKHSPNTKYIYLNYSLRAIVIPAFRRMGQTETTGLCYLYNLPRHPRSALPRDQRQFLRKAESQPAGNHRLPDRQIGERLSPQPPCPKQSGRQPTRPNERKNPMYITWLKATLIQAICTFAESALAYIGTGALLLGDVNWLAVLFAGAFGAMTALLLALAGLSEVEAPAMNNDR